MANHLAIKLDANQISDLIHSVTVRITHQVAQIDLRRSSQDHSPGDELCTVYTTLTGAYQTKLALCAQREFLLRLAENMAGEPMSDPEDLEEYFKEFFNVLCGHIVREIFLLSKAGAYFHPPVFLQGRRTPELSPAGQHTLLSFTGDRSERLAVLYGEIQPV